MRYFCLESVFIFIFSVIRNKSELVFTIHYNTFMSKFKRIAAFVLVFALAISFGITGFTAADEMLYSENWQYLEDILSYVAIGERSV